MVGAAVSAALAMAPTPSGSFAAIASKAAAAAQAVEATSASRVGVTEPASEVGRLFPPFKDLPSPPRSPIPMLTSFSLAGAAAEVEQLTLAFFGWTLVAAGAAGSVAGAAGSDATLAEGPEVPAVSAVGSSPVAQNLPECSPALGEHGAEETPPSPPGFAG